MISVAGTFMISQEKEHETTPLRLGYLLWLPTKGRVKKLVEFSIKGHVHSLCMWVSHGHNFFMFEYVPCARILYTKQQPEGGIVQGV